MNKKEIILGIWAVIAIAAIIFFVVLVMNKMTTTGAYTASTAFLQYEPKELCAKYGCEVYLEDRVNLPIHLRSGLSAAVTCICQGELRSFQLRQTNLGVYNPNYYPIS